MKSLLAFCVVVHQCLAHRILVVFPIPGNSHAILGEGYVRHLLDAGHEVTYITPVVMKDIPKNLRIVDVTSNFQLMPQDMFGDVKKYLTKEIDMTGIDNVLDLLYVLTNGTLFHENVQRLLLDPNEKFDLIIAEWMYSDLYSGFSSVFNCPLIWSSSMEPHSLVLSLIDENPNPAYTADHMSPVDPPFTFWQRATELWTLLKYQYIKWVRFGINSETFNKAFGPAATKRGHKLPPLSEAMYSGSLMLGNSYVSSGQPVRLPQNYKPIGGYHIKEEIQPLPKDLQKIMDESQHGVIYFSMGSMLKSNTWPEEMKREILDVFRALKQTVIWKFEEALPNAPANLHIVSWAPQQSILAHPNCTLFITHGGLLSTTETLHYGVPVIGIPVFADQFININRAVNKGYGLKVDFSYDIPKNLRVAIEEVLGNPRYREKVKELSFVHRHRPTSPTKELVHWVDHVVRTRGAPHLRSPALQVPFYQKLYLDLLGVAVIIVASIIYISSKIFSRGKVDKIKKLN